MHALLAAAFAVAQFPTPAPSPALQSVGTVRVASRTHHALSTLPIQADRVNAPELHAIPGRSIESSLATIPGYAQAGTSSWFLGPHSNYAELRGLGPRSVLVTFDGVPLNDPLGSWVSWGRVPKLLVGSVEAVHGGASALYGSQAVGGVIAIESVHPTRDAVAYDAFTGNMGTGGGALALEHALSGGWGASVYVDHQDAKGYIRGAGPNTNAPSSPFARYHGQRYSVQLAHGDAASGLFEVGALENEEHRTGDFSGPSWYYGRTGFTRWRRDGAHSSVESVAYLSNDSYTFNDYFGSGGSYFATGADIMSIDTAGLLTGVSRSVGAVTFTAGVDGRNVAGTRNGIRFSSPSSRIDGLQQFAGTFAQADAVFGRSEAILGARYDLYTERQAQKVAYGLGSGTTLFPSSAAHHVSPRIAYRYSFSPRFLVRASFGDAFKAPDWGSLYSTYPLGGGVTVVGNPLLKAQTTDQLEGGVEWNPDARTRAYATVYAATQQGRVVLSQISPTLYSNQNVSQARSGGYELSFQRQVGDHLALRAGYANTPTRITQDPTSGAVGNLIPQTPVSTGYAGVRLFDASKSAELELRSIGRAYANEQNTQPIDGAVLVDASASRAMGNAGELYVEIQNLFNRQWLAEATTYAPPRSILFGIRKALR